MDAISRKRLRCWWAGLGAMAGVLFVTPEVGAQPAVALVNVRVLSMTDSVVRAGQTVIVEGGRISWVGTNKAARIPAGATRVDGQGAYLLPGFADMHVHLGRPADLATYLANGITTVRSLSGSDSVLAWRRLVAADSLVGPRVITAGPILDGDPPAMPGLSVLTDPAQARPMIVDQRTAGYDFVKVYNSLSRAVYD